MEVPRKKPEVSVAKQAAREVARRPVYTERRPKLENWDYDE
jgi:hypothetical protein